MKDKTYKLLCIAILCLTFLMGCEKEEDMIVNREASPVLVTVAGNSFTAAETVLVTATIYELDKSGILNNAVGIDSIPLSNLSIKVVATVGSGSTLKQITLEGLTTDTNGQVSLLKSWAELGIVTPITGITVNMEWVGQHKGQNFTKLSKVQVK